jgi:hypothetical protein
MTRICLCHVGRGALKEYKEVIGTNRLSPVACVNGISDPTLATCNANGTSPSVQQNYMCNTGFYSVPDSEYCRGVWSGRKQRGRAARGQQGLMTCPCCFRMRGWGGQSGYPNVQQHGRQRLGDRQRHLQRWLQRGPRTSLLHGYGDGRQHATPCIRPEPEFPLLPFH